jgi:hypothetical protein
VLPVHNAQETLEASVTELLEVLPDLTPRFEVLLIYGASTDDTQEVAYDLATRYPQVHVIRHATASDRLRAIRCGLEHSAGDVILLRDEASGINIQDLRKLWRRVGEFAAVIGRCPAAAPATVRGGWGHVLREWGMAATAMTLGGRGAALQLLHRQVAVRLCQEAADADDLTAELTRAGYRLCEVELRPASARPTPAFAPTMSAHRGPAPTRLDLVPQPASRPAPKRPRYLERLKAFALGE